MAATPDEEGLDIHRVAIVTFLYVRGVDERDAGTGGFMAMQQNLRPGHVLEFRSARGHGKAMVTDSMEVGMAAGNGYLWTGPTGKAFREDRHPDPEERI